MHRTRYPYRLMDPSAVLLLAVAVLTAGFAQPEETFPAAQFVPPDLMQGEHYRVGEKVVNDGCTNRYVVNSDYGAFEAHGDPMLRTRIHEVQALARLDELAKAKGFAGGARESLLKRWRAVKHLFVHPVRTVKNLPRGTARYVGNYYRMLKGGRGELEEPASKELIRFSAAKRGLAAYVGADPYSSNPVLQDALNEMAWAVYAGGITLEVGRFFIPASDALTVVELTTTTVGMSEALASQSPESLRAANKVKLREAGVSPELVEDFLKHAWYSPRHESLLVDALYRMAGVADRDAFVRLALSAESEEDALWYQRAAEMLAGYHALVAPLARLSEAGGLPTAYAAQGTLVVALPADYVRWTEANARTADNVAAARGHEPAGTPVEVWVAGGVAPVTAQELQLRGAQVHAAAWARLVPEPPAEPQPEATEAGQ